MNFKVGDKVTTRDGRKAKITGISATFYHITCKNGEKIICGESQIKPRFPWKKFKNGNFAVHCKTEAEAKNFFERAKKHGYHWRDETRKTRWGEYGNCTCYRATGKLIRYSTFNFYKKELEVEIVDWSNYMEPDLHQTVKELGESVVKGIEAVMNPEERFKQEYLKHLKDGGYNWIARDECGIVYAYKFKPVKKDAVWESNPFHGIDGSRIITLPEVKWEDPEPTPIEDLIKEGKE